MIEAWLDSPVWALLGSLALFYTITAGLLYWASFHGPCRRWIAGFRDVEGPVFGAAALLFAMLTGFVASDVWHRNDEAERAVAAEADTLSALQGLARVSGLDNAVLQSRIQGYARAVVNEEWPSMGEGRAAPHAGQAMRELLHEVLDARYAAAGPLVQRTLFEQALKVGDLRAQRILISGQRTDPYKWAAVIALSVLTQVAIALMHLDKPLGQVAALAVFSVAAFVGLGLVAVQESPFTYPIQVSPAPIEKLLPAAPPQS